MKLVNLIIIAIFVGIRLCIPCIIVTIYSFMSKLTLASTYNLNKLQGLLQILSTALGLNTFNNYKVINIKGE